VSSPVLVDTSALYALLDRDDRWHTRAARIWSRLLDGWDTGDVALVTHNGILVEATALAQRRLGVAAVRDLHHGILTVVDVAWVDAALHARALAALVAAGRRDVSLVDWTSFELMRTQGIERAFAFDGDFTRQGFVLER
jgi:predicted nucleic acid-binding protein